MWIYDVFNVLLILESFVMLVCLHSCKLHKIHEIPSACCILSPLGSLGDTLPHGWNGEWVVWPTGSSERAPLRSQMREFSPAGAVSVGRVLTQSCCLPRRNLLLDRRAGRGHGTREAGERQRRREKLVPTNGRVNQRESQTRLLLRERRPSRSPGLLLNSKPARNLWVSFWVPHGVLLCSEEILSSLPFTVLKSNTASSLRCGLFAVGKHLNDTL